LSGRSVPGRRARSAGSARGRGRGGGRGQAGSKGGTSFSTLADVQALFTSLGLSGTVYDFTDNSLMNELNTGGGAAITNDGDVVGLVTPTHQVSANVNWQAASTARPAWRNAANGSGLQFDGANDGMASNLANPWSYLNVTWGIALLREGAGGSAQRAFGRPPANTGATEYRWGFTGSATTYGMRAEMNGATVGADPLVGVDASTALVLSASSAGTIWQNGSSLTTFTGADVTYTASDGVIGRRNLNNATQFLAGRLFAAYVVNAELANADRAVFDSYLQSLLP